jgi:hypothetical protein
MSVPRGAYHGYGGGAAGRHPQPGYGYSHGHGYGYGHGNGHGYGYGHGHYGHSHGYYGRYGYGYGYPYYGYSAYYSPYYYGYPYGSAGLYLGWPSVGVGLNYYSGPSYSYGVPPAGEEAPPREDGEHASEGSYRVEPPPPSEARGYSADTGRVRLDARPADASVYVDDDFWGAARDSRVLTLRTGRHTIELVRPGHATVRRDVEVARGGTLSLVVEMERPAGNF